MASYKVIVIGEIAVGKTSLIRRLIEGRFEGNYKTTVGFDVYVHDIPLQSGDAAHFAIWDFDGDIADSIVQHHTSDNSSGALIVSDVTRPETFTTAAALAKEFRKRFPGRPYLQLANKIDLDPGAPRRKIEGLSGGESEVIFTSALSGENVLHGFATMAETLVRRRL